MFTQPFRADSPQPSRQQQSSQSEDNRQQHSQGDDKTRKGTDKPAQQMGEGSYEATRDYQENIKTYLDKADVKADAEAAQPASPGEADELKKAEEEGLSHTKAPGQ